MGSAVFATENHSRLMTRNLTTTDAGSHPRFMTENPPVTAVRNHLSNVSGNFIPLMGGNAVPFRFEPNPTRLPFEFPLPLGVPPPGVPPLGVPPPAGYPSSYNLPMPPQDQSQAGIDLVSFALAHTPNRNEGTTAGVP